MQFLSLACGVVLCDAVRCCAVPCCAVWVSAFLYSTIISLNHNKIAPPAQLSAQLYTAHRSAAPCGAVRCRALPCGAVLFHAALFRTYSSTRYMMRRTRYQVPVCTCFCTRLSAFFKVDCPLSAPMFFSPRKLHPHGQSEGDTANKHTA